MTKPALPGPWQLQTDRCRSRGYQRSTGHSVDRVDEVENPGGARILESVTTIIDGIVLYLAAAGHQQRVEEPAGRYVRVLDTGHKTCNAGLFLDGLHHVEPFFGGRGSLVGIQPSLASSRLAAIDEVGRSGHSTER